MTDKQQVADDDLESLRKQRDSANVRASTAERAAATAADENEKLKTAVGQERANRVQADELAAVNALAAAETVANQAEAAIAAAGAASDWAALAKAQRALATAQNDINAWTSQKSRIESWKKEQVAKIARAEAVPEGAKPAYTPKTQAWLDKHPEVASDEKKMLRATSAHLDAVAQDLIPESDEYFAFVEERLGLKAAKAAEPPPPAEGDTEVPDEAPPPAADATDQALPPQRKTPTLSAKLPPGKVRLTAAQVEAAQFSFPDMKKDDAIREYAKNLVGLQKEGRMAS